MISAYGIALVALALLLVPATPALRLHALTGSGRRRTGARLRGGLRSLWGKRVTPATYRETDAGSDVALVADLLAASLTAGLPVPTAVRAVAAVTSGPVTEVLRSTGHALALGANADVAWQRARDIPDTAELARAACRTASSGSALAKQAAELAERTRHRAADRAEATAQRVSVLVAGPLGLCFLPAFLCLGVIPVVLGLATRLTVFP